MTSLNISLLPWQQEVWNDDTRFKVVAAGRRTGKSRLAAYLLLFNALSESQGQVFYVAPTQGQARDIMWDTLLDIGQDVIKSTHVNNLHITLINGKKIALKGADRPETMRGVSLKFLVLDEYADIKPEVWEQILRPALADQQGNALFIGTPMGRNHFYDLYNGGLRGEDPTVKSWHFTSFDNPYLKKEEIEAARKTMTSHAFRQEFLASFEAQGGDLFKEEWIKVSKDEPTDGDFYVAIDLAGFSDGSKKKHKRLDSTAISVVKAGQHGWYVKDIVYGRWEVKETAQHIFHVVNKYKPVAVGIEKGSLKQAVMPYLFDMMKKHNVFFKIDDVTHGNQKKSERIVWSLQGRFANNQITLNDGEYLTEFLDQLFQFPNPLVHDDLIDSLSYVDQLAKVTYAAVDDFEYDFEVIDPLTGY